jgi:uncharacterized protein (UPF0332 family)
MSWKSLLAANRVQRHATTREEQDDLRSVVERDLADAALPGLSDDRAFATAYNAVLQLAKMVIAASGYRVVGQGHHHTSFQAVELALGKSAANYTAYFDACRRKRNQLDYDVADVATHTESQELLAKAREFHKLIEAWLTTNYPHLALTQSP